MTQGCLHTISSSCRAAFKATERDGVAPLAVLNDVSPSLNGGAAVV